MPEADEDYIKEARQELQMQNTKDQLVRVVVIQLKNQFVIFDILSCMMCEDV